ncbi:Proline--tRNA ligase [uncultured archaeon]|nr:Proline--tRNA ligase [uncultured archaeon]
MSYDTILEIGKRRGIVYPSFEIYGGLAGFIDYGPVGSRIKNNLQEVLRRQYIVSEGCMEVECPTVSPEPVWVASGHVKSFADITTECLKCGEPYRADHLVAQKANIRTEGMSISDLAKAIDEYRITCPKCGGKLENPYTFNLMFQTHVGPGRNKVTAYLRPETAQTTYLPFKRLFETARRKLPFGVLQIGRSYRNEISPRQVMIRLREFLQAEIQYFLDPATKNDPVNLPQEAKKNISIRTKKDDVVEKTIEQALNEGIITCPLIAYHLALALRFFTDVGIDPSKLSLRQHRDDERAFYSSDTWDVEYLSPSIGRIELVGISDRGDYDLTQHINVSKQDLSVNIDGRKFVPHVLEVAYGVDRPIYCLLESCLRPADKEGRDYEWFAFPPAVAPYRAGVFALQKKDNLPEKAREVFELLKNAGLYVYSDESGSIGRRYARADEIGVPYAVTIDYDSLKDGTVTVRDRDTKQQRRVSISELPALLK